MLDKHLIRQAEIIPKETLGIPITVIGAGAIGSFITLGLAKMGFSDISVYDFDKVSEENMNSQFYPLDSIGFSKVHSLAMFVHDFTGCVITPYNRAYELDSDKCKGIVITAVDSMKTRRQIWERHKRSAITAWFIDPRMSAEQGLLYVVNPHLTKDIDHYEASLYSDDMAMQEPCTAKATIYTSFLLSGLTCKAVKDVVTNAPIRLRTSLWNIKENELKSFCVKGGNND